VRTTSRSLRLLAVLFSVLLLAAACGSGDDEGGGSSKSGSTKSGKKEGGTAATGEDLPADTLVDYQALSADNPNHIDPATADTRQGSQITELIYDSLTVVDSKNELQPAVAEKWEANEDSTVWTFTLRDDAVFSNGEKITPTTFVKSWERVLNPALASTLAYHFGPIKGATEFNDGKADTIEGLQANDADNTLVVTLGAPLSEFDQIVSHTVFSPVPKEAYEATTAKDINKWERGLMIGNGPFKMSAKWKDNEFIKVEENEKYYGTPTTLKKIEFRISKKVESAYSAFEGGEGDTGYIPPGAFADATDTYNNSTDPSFGLYYFGIAWEDPDLGGPDNLPIRQAISLAIDRQRINDQVYDGARENATGVTPPGIPGYKADLCGDFCTQDLARAKDLVKQWGKADSMKPIKLQYNLGGGHEDVTAIIQENLEELGLKVEQDPRDGETYFDEMKKKGGCHLCRAGWIWDYPSYYNVNSMFNSSGIDGDNLGRYASDAFDAKAAEASKTADADERAKLWAEAEKILFDDMGVIVINWYTNQVVYSDRVEGLVVNGLQAVNYPEITLKAS
jgi:oligopeptide transport system substrate-binding protein